MHLTFAVETVSRYTVTPGLLGFALFAFLGAAVFLLARSLRKHLGRIDVDGDRDS